MKSVAVLSLANLDIQKDSRVLRQVKYLSSIYPVEIITYGNADSIPYPTKSILVVGSLSKGKWGRRLRQFRFYLWPGFGQNLFMKNGTGIVPVIEKLWKS